MLSNDNEGNRYYFTKGHQLIALNGSGEEIWRTEIELYNDLDNIVRRLITDTFGRIVAIQKSSSLQLFSGVTGAVIASESFDYIISLPQFSSSGNFLAIETNNWDDMLNFTHGIRAYSIPPSDTGITEAFHSTITLNKPGRFIPISVSDQGFVLARFIYPIEPLYRLVLLDSSGNAVWISAPFSSESRGFTRSCGGFAGMTQDGSAIWHFYGNHIHAYKLVRGQD